MVIPSSVKFLSREIASAHFGERPLEISFLPSSPESFVELNQ